MKISKEKHDQIKAALDTDESYASISTRLHVGRTTITKVKRGEYVQTDEGDYKEELTTDFKADTGVITTRSLNIKTVEDALAMAKIDLSLWDVDRCVINSWEVTMKLRTTVNKTQEDIPETCTNWQVKVWLKRKTPQKLEFESILEEIKDGSPIIHTIKRDKVYAAKDFNRVLEVSLFDPHLGLRCFKPASDVDWTPDIAYKTMFGVLEKIFILSEVYGPFDYILFPFGNDFLHSENGI
ncbi:MAG TPA: hypothetical protein ENI23_16815 [bacterium]|nr:hypothetical protein [bacterium]